MSGAGNVCHVGGPGTYASYSSAPGAVLGFQSSPEWITRVYVHNTLLTLLNNQGCLWTLSNLQHPSMPSPVPHGQATMNPRPHSNTGFIKHHPQQLPNPDPVSKYSIISCTLIASDPNPVLPFMYTPSCFTSFHIPITSHSWLFSPTSIKDLPTHIC